MALLLFIVKFFKLCLNSDCNLMEEIYTEEQIASATTAAAAVPT